MKKHFQTFVLLTAVAAFTFSCTESQKASEGQDSKMAQTDATAEKATPTAGEQKHFGNYGKDFQRIAIGFEGVVRKVAIGTPGDWIKQLESEQKSKLIQETAQQLIYEEQIDTNETLRATYHLDGNNSVHDLDLEIKLDNNESYEAVMAEFTDFFTHKYGQVIINAKGDEVWRIDGTEKHEIDVIGEIKGKDFIVKVIVAY